MVRRTAVRFVLLGLALALGLAAAGAPSALRRYAAGQNLAEACRIGDYARAEAALAAGASPDTVSFDGSPALILACNSPRIVRLLLEHGAHPDMRERIVGWTALECAVASRSAGSMMLLLAHGADPNAATSSGDTPLMVAAQIPDTRPAQLLIRSGARVDAADAEGTTALMWAARKGYASSVSCLLRAGADPSARNRRGQTALDLAREHHRTAVVKLLGSWKRERVRPRVARAQRAARLASE